MVAQSDFTRHPSEEALERYALGRVSSSDVAPLEEHLFVCEHCQRRLSETDRYILAVRDAARILLDRSRETAPAQPVLSGIRKPRREVGRKLLWPVGALAFAALALSIVVPQQAFHRDSRQDVLLEVSRGAGPRLLTAVPASQPVRLDLDLTEIAPARSYRLDVVNDDGQLEWSGAASPAGNKLHFAPSHALRPGKHWARLYALDGSPVLVREYGMEAR